MSVEARKAIYEWARGDATLLSARCFKAEEALGRTRRLLLSVEGAILAYWTDIPEAVLDDFRVRIRAELGDWEPTS